VIIMNGKISVPTGGVKEIAVSSLGMSCFYMERWRWSADSRVPDVPVTVKPVAGSGIIPFSIFVVSVREYQGHLLGRKVNVPFPKGSALGKAEL
jgi:hypothetical protein